MRKAALLILSAALFSACGPATAGPAPDASPTPAPTPFDQAPWAVSTIGVGPAATPISGGLQLFIPASAQADANHQQLIAINVTAKCKISGDFDLQADYALQTWPARNGVRFGLVAGDYHVVRTSDPHAAENTYTTNLAGAQTSAETQDSTGRLRLARTGTTITGYYLTNRTWTTIASAPVPTAAASYAIAAWTDGYSFGRADVRVNLTKFTFTPSGAGCD
jgi:hypothetical protein